METRRKFMKATGTVGVASLTGYTTQTDSESAATRSVTVTIENLSYRDGYEYDTPDGKIWLTAGAYAVHDGENPIPTGGEEAGAGLTTSESGLPDQFPTGLVEELSLEDDGEVADYGIFFTEDVDESQIKQRSSTTRASLQFDATVSPGQCLSFATMVYPSSSLFYAPSSSGITLWPEGGDIVSGEVTEDVELWAATNGANNAVQLASDVDGLDEYPSVDSTIEVTVMPTE